VRDRGPEQRGVHAGPVTAWTAAHKTVLRVAAVALVALIFVFWAIRRWLVVIWLLVLLLVLLGVIELLGGGRPRPAASGGRAPRRAAVTGRRGQSSRRSKGGAGAR